MHSSPVGNDLSVREPWLALRAEPALEPALPVVDAHHHFYERPGWTYLPGDDLADAASGHAVVATVSMQALTRHRPAGPAALQPKGGWAAIPIPRANAAGAPPCPGLVCAAGIAFGQIAAFARPSLFGVLFAKLGNPVLALLAALIAVGSIACGLIGPPS